MYTNTNELKAEIVRHGDTGITLADYLGITTPTMSNKLNGKADFTQPEIAKIIERYNLANERLREIFFGSNVAQ